mgnify:CR=1 FL=1
MEREILAAAADGVLILDAEGRVIFSDAGFAGFPQPTQSRCTTWCAQINMDQEARTHIECDGQFWELRVRPMESDLRCGLLTAVDAEMAHQHRLADIDRIGLMMMHVDRTAITEMSVADRLSMLEKRIIEDVKREMKFDHFEIRLRAPASDRLELVISESLSPMRVGETISVSETGNGISGFVAATGKSYICSDVRNEPRYSEGLDNARSSLTVPLLLQNEVIGVFNIESDSIGVFTDADRVMAERLAIYIAHVLHLLDLLVVERVTTSERVARTISSELEQPLAELQQLAGELGQTGHEECSARLQRILGEFANRIATCAAGPRSLLDAEHELHGIEPDPACDSISVLVVDDEDRVRIEVSQVLEKLGCQVTKAQHGGEAFSILDQTTHFDLIVSDIRLPDASGYEVFTRSRDAIPNVPVILMTGFGYDPDHTIVRASADGVQGILLKPFRTSQLIEAVRSALNAGVTQK